MNAEFERLAQDLARARQTLKEKITDLETQRQILFRQELPEIRRAASRAAELQEALREAISDHPECFVKPKTMILHGIRFGYQKGKGAMDWDDDEKVVRLIKKHFPDMADVLIKTTEKPVKKALNGLPAADLRRIGITVEETGDEIFIKFTDSEIDKIVNAILSESEEAVAEIA